MLEQDRAIEEPQSSEQVQPRQHLPLSPTEKRVCALLLNRMTEKQVAEYLSRSPNTVHVHVRNIYRKLGIRSRETLYQYPEIVRIILADEK